MTTLVMVLLGGSPAAHAVRLKPTPATEAFLREHVGNDASGGAKVSLFPGGFGAAVSLGGSLFTPGQGEIAQTLVFDVEAEAGDAPNASACVFYSLTLGGLARVVTPFGNAAAGFGGPGGVLVNAATSPVTLASSIPLTITHDPVVGPDSVQFSEPPRVVSSSGSEQRYLIERTGRFPVRVGDSFRFDFALAAAARGDNGPGAAEAASTLTFLPEVRASCSAVGAPGSGPAAVPVNAPWALAGGALALALTAFGFLARRRRAP